MPIYKYKCDNCKYNGELFLNIDFEYTNLRCASCGARNTAKQLRNKKYKFQEKDGVTGVLEREE